MAFKLFCSLLFIIFESSQLVAESESSLSLVNKKYIPRMDLGLPIMQTFSSEQYNGNNQNWSLAQATNGMIYVGNGNGVLEFDGNSWRMITSDNNTLIRSLAVDPSTGRIYVGAVGEIGYLEPDEKGQMQFVSLMPKIPKEQQDFGDVWQIFVTSKGIVFSTFTRLIRINGDLVESWVPKDGFHFSFSVGPRVFIREIGRGLLELIGNELQMIPDGEKFADERVYGIIAWPKLSQTGLLIGSRTQGLFVYDGQSVMQLPTEIDAEIKKALLYSILQISEERIALATLQSGVFIIDNQGNLIQKLDREAGLKDNTVTAMMLDTEEGLWLALSRGIVRAEVNNPVSYFSDQSGLGEDVMSMEHFRGVLYVGTGSGLLRQKLGAKSTFQPVPQINNQVWDLLEVNGRLLASGYLGVFEVTESATKVIYKGDTVFSMAKNRFSDTKVILGERNGIRILELKDGTWKSSEKISVLNLKDSVRRIYQSSSGDLWLNTYASGLFRISNYESKHRVSEQYGVEQGLPDLTGSDIFHIEGKLSVSTSKGIYLFDSTSNSFKPDERFENIFPDGQRSVFELVEEPGKGVWLITQLSSTSINETGLAERLNSGEYIWRPGALKSMTIIGSSDMYRDPNGVLWIAGGEGLYRFDPSKKREFSQRFNLQLRGVLGADGELLYGGAGKPDLLSIPFENNRLRFEFSGLNFNGLGKNNYQVFLEGEDDNWSDWSLEAFKDYSNLWEGDYNLRLRAQNIYGTTVESVGYQFKIVPPWYRTYFAYTMYLIALGAFFWIIMRWRLQKLHQQKQLLRSRVKERTQQLSTIGDVGREITASLNLEAIFETLYQNMNKMFDAKVCGIGIYHPNRAEIEFTLAIENGQRYKPYVRRMDDKSQLAVWCVEHCKPVLLGDIKNEYSQYVDEYDSSSGTMADGTESKTPQSAVYVPIVVQDKVIGVLSVQSFSKNAYRKQHIKLLQTLASYAGIAIDNGRAHEELLVAYKSVQEASVTDQLTGLKNRRFLMVYFKEDINKTLRDYTNWDVGRRSEMPVESDHVFFLLDLDHFKQVNDTYGHAAGDNVLIQIKLLLTKVFRDSDFLIRWGGEEFLIISRFTQRNSGSVQAERLRLEIEQHEFDIGEGQSIRMTASIGFTSFPFIRHEFTAITWEQVVNIADRCLYVAKENKRNAWVGVFAGDKTKSEAFASCLANESSKLFTDHDLTMMTSIPKERKITL